MSMASPLTHRVLPAGVFDAAGNPATYAAVPVPSTAGVL